MKEQEIKDELKALLLPNMGCRHVDPAIEKIMAIINRERGESINKNENLVEIADHALDKWDEYMGKYYKLLGLK